MADEIEQPETDAYDPNYEDLKEFGYVELEIYSSLLRKAQHYLDTHRRLQRLIAEHKRLGIDVIPGDKRKPGQA